MRRMLRLALAGVAATILVVDLAPPLWIVIRELVSYAVRMIAG